MDPSALLPLVFLGIVTVPIILVIVFVVQRNAARRAAQASVFQAVAAQYGGQFVPAAGAFGGNSVLVYRPYAQIKLETVLLSVMNAAGSPYHSDGGTFTHARAMFAGGNGPGARCTRDGAQQVPVFAGIPSVAALPPDAVLFCNPMEVIVVMPGAVADGNVLGASLHFVNAVAERIAGVMPQQPQQSQPGAYPR